MELPSVRKGMRRTQNPDVIKTLQSRHLAWWWRGTVEVETNNLKVVKPCTPYNIFDYYFPPRQRIRDTRSLPYLFANMDTGDLRAVVEFSQCFGPIGKVFSEEKTCWTSTCKELFLDSFGVPPRFVDTETIGIEAFRLMQRKVRKMLRRLDRSATNAEARAMLPKRLTNWRRMHPQLTWDDENTTWVTVWKITSLEAGIYLMLHMDLQRGGFVRLCRREDCSQWFKSNHPRIHYCSNRCENTAQVRRYRANSAARADV
jgi:hypothetical protein